jgi:hypothetical protein
MSAVNERSPTAARLTRWLGCSRGNPARRRTRVFNSSNQCSTTTMLASVAPCVDTARFT